MDLVRHVAWFLKIKGYLLSLVRKRKVKENFEYIETNYIEQSILSICQLSQKESFANIFSSDNNQLICDNNLLPLTPIITDGILRIGGRLKHAEIPNRAKHQII